MDTLEGTAWDIAIVGTGLQPALLALALSRSDRKILHLDSNDYYGGAEAALSISEADKWAERHSKDRVDASRFSNASVHISEPSQDGSARLESPRAYNIALSPRLLYSRTALLPALVSSKAHEQLEFLAVGSWFVWRRSEEQDGHLLRVPNSREDIFSDPSLTLRAKSALVKFLRFVAVYQDEEKKSMWTEHKTAPFGDFLVSQFKIPAEFHGPLLALTMSPKGSSEVLTEPSLQAIHRHLTSMGVFGAGFSAVLSKYGGLSEAVQVACRAAAVGGAVYVLNRAVERVHRGQDGEKQRIQVGLSSGDTITTSLLFATGDQLPDEMATQAPTTAASHMTAIIGSRLSALFPTLVEGSAAPSAAVVVFPSNTIPADSGASNETPIHLLVHSGDTGECPAHQCVVYASTAQLLANSATFLSAAIGLLLRDVESPTPQILWSMLYESHLPSADSAPSVIADTGMPGLYRFVEPSYSPVLDDRIIDSVKQAWKIAAGVEADGDGAFLRFLDRSSVVQDEADDVA